MEFFRTLLDADPAAPRLTVYDESTGSRLDFSATTLDNWACKIANMLQEEFDLEPGDLIGLCVPPGWQACVLACGAAAIGVDYDFDNFDDASVLFAAPDRVPEDIDCEVCLITSDPFGRGVEETGGTLPDGMVDFGPTVRMFGDDFPLPTPTLEDVVDVQFPQATAGLEPGARVLSSGFVDEAGFARTVLGPWAVGGSAIIVLGMASTERLAAIAAEEKATTVL